MSAPAEWTDFRPPEFLTPLAPCADFYTMLNSRALTESTGLAQPLHHSRHVVFADASALGGQCWRCLGRTSAANVRLRDTRGTKIGRWDFDGGGHAGFRELRGAGLLAAWLNWSDSRFDNTRLVVVHKHGAVQMRHYFTDLGGGLGEGNGFISRRGESPNEFAWSFTKPAKDQGHGQMRVPFKTVGYRPLDETPAFKEMTPDDARWMARLIGKLTETQLKQGLIASGFDSAQVRLYTEKLISRRDRMIIDLGLEDEIPLLRAQGPYSGSKL